LEDGSVKIGPQSVAHKLKTEARCFGGRTLTATDLALAAGFVEIPDAKIANIGLTKEQVEAGMEEIKRMV